MKSNLDKRTFAKLFGIILFSFFFMPFKFTKAVTKKIINENLSKKQKEIMFNERTEVFTIVQTVVQNCLHPLLSLTAALAGHHLRKLYQVRLKLKLITPLE